MGNCLQQICYKDHSLKKNDVFFSRHKFFCLFYFSIFRTLYILKQVFWGRNLISIFLASQNRYHTNTEVSQIWMKKKEKMLTQRMFLRIKILIWYTYLYVWPWYWVLFSFWRLKSLYFCVCSNKPCIKKFFWDNNILLYYL